MTAPTELAVFGETFDLLLGVRDALGEALAGVLSAEELEQLADAAAAEALVVAEVVLADVGAGADWGAGR